MLCVVGLSAIDEAYKGLAGGREEWMKRIHERHRCACDDISTKLARHLERRPKTTKQLLVALAWYEGIHDQGDRHTLFPCDLADSIFLSKSNSNRDSQMVFSWMNTLDNEGTHLGGEQLLSQQNIEIVSHYQTQIPSSRTLDGGVAVIDSCHIPRMVRQPTQPLEAPPIWTFREPNCRK
jgi:hypothetical protein